MIEYRTIKTTGTHEIIIKKSRFICNIKHVETEEEAEDFINQIKKEHYKATHNCVAYQIGEKNEIQRALDNGEPSGTAGIPMLEALKHMELQNVVAVVTRYFGGIKLGAGGLIRAYSNAVSEAVHEIGVIERTIQHPVSVTVDYAFTGPMDNWIANHPYTLLDTTYLEKVTYTLGVPKKDVETFQQTLTDFTNGQAQFEVADARYVDIPVSPDPE
ncbi:MAG: YigZ family protein [Aerococcus sp.]|nr:YigZ family protein [Aerococcus sp.]